MKAVVLCGGRGERLMPMTDRRPAALLRLCGKEILLFTLEMLEKAGFEEAVLAVGYGSEQVERLLDEKYSGKIKLHMINTAGKSTVQAVRTAMCDETEILAVECNCICTHPLDEIIKVHLSHDTFCTALTYDTENKPAGIYIVKRELFDSLNPEKPIDMTEDIIPEAVKSGEAVLLDGKGYYKRITTPEAFLDCQRHMLYNENMSLKLTENNFSGAAIGEPVYIGENVSVMSGSVIESGSVIDNNAVVKGGKVNGYVGIGSVVSERCDINSAVVCRGAVLDCGICQAGVNVYSIGRAGISELSYAVNRFGGEFGILIGANISGHARLISAGGMLPDEKLLDRIGSIADDRAYRSVGLSQTGCVTDFSAVREIYVAELEKILPDRFKGVNVDIRTYDVKKATLADRLFHGRNDIDGERIIFNLSADGTKVSAYSEKTSYVMWEKLVAMYAGVCFEKGLAVALPENFPSIADAAAEDHCGRLYRYENNADIAKDVAVSTHNMFAYDGLYLASAVTSYLSEQGITLQKALCDVPDAYTSSRFVGITMSRENKEKIFSELGCSAEGEITMGKTHAVIRPLRDKKGITVFAESVSCEQAAAFCEDITSRIKGIFR